MTREEEITRAADAVSQYESPSFFEAFVTGAQWADAHPHWISVEEEGFPTKDGCYLFYAEGEPVYMCYYYADFKTSLATHWMPLPKMPVLSNSSNIGKDLKEGVQ